MLDIGSSLAGRCAAMLAVGCLLLFARGASAAETCAANFTHGGDAARGLSFSTSRTIAGLAPGDAIAQYKAIAVKEGFKPGRETGDVRTAELVISQLPTASARGFDLRITADADGKVSVSTTLPPGMTAAPEAFQTNMCGALDRLRVGASPADVSAQVPDARSAAAVSSIAPQQTTDLCLANFLPNGNIAIGRTYSTWSLGEIPDLPSALGRVKDFTARLQNVSTSAEDVHGPGASMTITFPNAASIIHTIGMSTSSAADRMGFSMVLKLDRALGAASVTTYLNPDQNDDPERVQGLSCGLLAIVFAAPLPPDPSKPAGFRFRNPFKNEQKIAQKRQDAQIQLMLHAVTTLRARAPAAGKALVFMPMNNLDYKYRQSMPRDLSAGGKEHQAFRFDETLTMVWRAVGGVGGTLRAGVMDSLSERGLFGFVQSMQANQKYYGLYLVDPGRYALIGLSYHLFDATLPALGAEKWSSTQGLGVAAPSPTRDTLFSHQSQWTNAQYKDTQVYDGSSCGAAVSGGGVTACVSWDDHYHAEKEMTDSGGWRDLVTKGYTGGMDVAIKLARPFAAFDVAAGDLIVTDGFSAIPASAVFDEKACHQTGENTTDCRLKSLKLFRIAGSLQDFAAAARKSAENATFIAGINYRSVAMYADKLGEMPGMYESAWTTPYAMSTP